MSLNTTKFRPSHRSDLYSIHLIMCLLIYSSHSVSSSLLFFNIISVNFGCLAKKKGSKEGAQWASLLVYLDLFVGRLNLVLPRGKGKRLQREEGERSRFNAAV